MTRAGTGEAQLPPLRAVLDAATIALELVIIAVIYFGLAESALLLPVLNPVGTPLWPATGVALGIILLRGYRVAPGIFVGCFVAHVVASGVVEVRPFVEAGAIALGTTLAALAGAWLINRWSHGRKTFASPLGIGKFALVCFGPVAVIASAVAMAGTLVGKILTSESGLAGALANWPMLLSTYDTWWLADAGGSLVMAPVIVLWAGTPQPAIAATKPTAAKPASGSNIADTPAMLLAAAAIGVVAFSPLMPVMGGALGGALDTLMPYRGMLGFLIVVPLMAAALRANQRDAATAALIFCAIAGVSAGLGSSADLNNSLLLLLAMAISTSLAPLILGAAVAAHRDTEARLLLAQGHLNRRVEQTQLAFKNAKRHFQIFMEGVSDYAIFLLDTSGRVASWNSGAQNIIGYKADEVIGKHFGIFYRPDERRAGEPKRALASAIKNGKHEVEGWRIRKNGTPFFMTGALTAIRDDDGSLIGLANIIRDATERRDTQEKLVEAREQLATAQKMEAIGKLTGGIAHDFNNLLMIIGGNAQTFKRLLDPKLPRAIEAIQTAAKRGESLTRQLLTFSRRQQLSPTVVDLNAGIRNMRTMLESSLRGNIVYNENIAQSVWPVKVDLAELELAIVNIAVNARDAMPNGGTFTLTAGNVETDEGLRDDEHNQGYVAISFSDSGMGIPPNLLVEDLRSVLHHQGSRQGHRPWPVAGLWLRPSGRRHGNRRQQGRRRHDDHGLSAVLRRRGDHGAGHVRDRRAASAAADGAGRRRQRGSCGSDVVLVRASRLRHGVPRLRRSGAEALERRRQDRSRVQRYRDAGHDRRRRPRHRSPRALSAPAGDPHHRLQRCRAGGAAGFENFA